MSSSEKYPPRREAQKERQWHSMEIEEVERALVARKKGLSPDMVRERRRSYGSNTFTKGHEQTAFDRLIEQLKSPLTIVLIVAAVITFSLEEYIDAFVITLALLVAVVVGVIQEGRASKAFQKLANSQVNSAMVVRSGRREEIAAPDLTLGDVVVLEAGMQVPADIRLFETKRLSINEATLTGEWLAVKKQAAPTEVGAPLAEKASMAYMGTYIAEGRALGYVVAVGDHTAVGMIASDLGSIVEGTTPLQAEVARVSRIVLVLILTLIVCIFVVGVLYGESMETMLFTSIAIAVAAIPEGLPAAVTIVLAVGMEALLKRGGLVRNLLAAETLGSTTYVLTDKTGTLTEARMAVTEVRYIGCEQDKSINTEEHCDWQHSDRAREIFHVAITASDAFISNGDEGTSALTFHGEPMERAMLEAACELCSLHSDTELRKDRTDYLPFSSENRFAAGLLKEVGVHTLCVTGAPELLLEHATQVSTEDGARVMSDADRQYFESSIHTETQQGKRIIAVVKREVNWNEISESNDKILKGNIFLGLLIFNDPVRKGVSAAIRGVMDAGAKVRLVTGDNADTALSIARQVGIAGKHDIALTGEDIAARDDDELLHALRDVTVFARVLPRQKMRLARVLQASGEIVAMTGDGINDAPALRKADIGIAIGSGTEVAKESSDLVLVNDSFATIYAAIEEGRRIIGNLRKIIAYLLSTSLTEVVLIGAAIVSGAPVPLLPKHILWANMIEEGLMSVAFAFEKGSPASMKERPEDIHEEGLLSKKTIGFILFVVGVISVLLISLYGWLRMTDVPIDELRSIMFLAISIDSLFMAFSFRSLHTPIWKINLRSNPFFFVTFILNFALLGIVVTVPFFQTLLSYEPLPFTTVLLPLGYGASTLVIVECAKMLFFRKRIVEMK